MNGQTRKNLVAASALRPFWWCFVVLWVGWGLLGGCEPLSRAEPSLEPTGTDAAQGEVAEASPERPLIKESPREPALPEPRPEPLPDTPDTLREAPPEPDLGPCRGTCSPWEFCMEQTCVGKGCFDDQECGVSAVCIKGKCRSKLECCTVGETRCKNNTGAICTETADGCGNWSFPALCTNEAQCFKGKCVQCRHRPCTDSAECCSGTLCQYGHCLGVCDTMKGVAYNPDCCDPSVDPSCQNISDICFPLQPGGQALCVPDGTEQKGDSCSVVKTCLSGTICINLQNGKGNRCYAECVPSQGVINNPRCSKGEECASVLSGPPGGLCVVSNRGTKNLYDACDANAVCASPNVCVGEPSSSIAYCLAPCDPQASACGVGFACVGYDTSDPKKGVCAQRCTQAGGKDTCTYGLCRQRGNETICY